MAWRIDFTRNADKAMRKLDKGVAARVFDELDEIAKLEDPRSRGKALTGNLAGVYHPVYQPISSPKRKAGKNQSAFGSVIST